MGGARDGGNPFPDCWERAECIRASAGNRPGIRYEALYARALSYAGLNVKDTDPAAKDLATKAREAALLGLKTLVELKKPDNMSPEDFTKQKQQPAILF